MAVTAGSMLPTSPHGQRLRFIFLFPSPAIRNSDLHENSYSRVLKPAKALLRIFLKFN
jgi:hypothetical protein